MHPGVRRVDRTGRAGRLGVSEIPDAPTWGRYRTSAQRCGSRLSSLAARARRGVRGFGSNVRPERQTARHRAERDGGPNESCNLW
jgi:hypothetical protein